MTVAIAPLASIDDLVRKYAVTDPVVRVRIEEFERERGNTFGDRFPFLGFGVDRMAYHDPQVDLVYKFMRSPPPLGSPDGQLAEERSSLDKAHDYLARHPEYKVRYAQTQFCTSEAGSEYLVQEYVPNVGVYDHYELLSDDFRLAVADAGEACGISEDFISENMGYDETTGQTILTDLLFITVEL